MSAWDALAAELDAWTAVPGGARLWWRDDDLVRPGPRIGRLLALSDRFAAPVLLAVVPQAMDPALAGLGGRFAWFGQHGWAHADNSLPPAPGARRKKVELGGSCDPDAAAADLARGWSRLQEHLQADRLLPVMVPPWNRIDPAILARLPALGYAGWSGFGARRPDGPLPAVNVHVDPIDWRGTGGFAGEGAAIGQLVAHLQAKRSGAADPEEPTGLMTHHAVHDAATWAFVAALLEAVAAHPHAAWVAPPALFPVPAEAA